MHEVEDREQNLFLDTFVALVYSVLLIVGTFAIQDAVGSFLSQFARYVGGLIVSIFTFFFAMILASIGKFILKSAVGEIFLSRYFVVFSCIFLVIVCFALSGHLMVWWMTAVLSVLGTVVAFFKKLFIHKVKKKVVRAEMQVKAQIDDARSIERDLRHQSIREMKELGDRIRGKR